VHKILILSITGDNMKARAKTAKEARKEFLQHIHDCSEYWASLPDQTPQERCDGVAFSILVMLDGESMDLPAMNISLSPHPDDKKYLKSIGENWFEPNMIINKCELHGMYIRNEYA
jgi:hypothetical protein